MFLVKYLVVEDYYAIYILYSIHIFINLHFIHVNTCLQEFKG